MLCIEPALFGKRAVMAGDFFFTHHFSEPRRNSLSEFSRVDEDQRRAMFIDEFGDLPVNFAPLLMRTDRRERRGRNKDRDIHFSTMPDVHERAMPTLTDQKSSNFFQRFLRGG